jgi:hypothetical protein
VLGLGENQGRSQGSTGVTVVRGPRARKEAARERAVKAKVDAVCFLEKIRKNKKKESK